MTFAGTLSLTDINIYQFPFGAVVLKFVFDVLSRSGRIAKNTGQGVARVPQPPPPPPRRVPRPGFEEQLRTREGLIRPNRVLNLGAGYHYNRVPLAKGTQEVRPDVAISSP